MGEPARLDDADVTTDAVLGGRLVLRQPRAGHRAGTDAVLLAAACAVAPGCRFVDVGSGVGTAGLALALRAVDVTGALLERDAEVANLADGNVEANGLAGRVRVVAADLFERDAWLRAGLGAEAATLVATNPPFFLEGTVHASARALQAAAHVLPGGGGGHGAWLRAALALLAPHGALTLIHRPEALPDLLEAARGRLGAIVIAPVLGRTGGDATRVIVSGIKGSRAPLRLRRPLVLHEPDGRFTPEAEAIHRGEASLPL